MLYEEIYEQTGSCTAFLEHFEAQILKKSFARHQPCLRYMYLSALLKKLWLRHCITEHSVFEG